eukprot:g14969.t1
MWCLVFLCGLRVGVGETVTCLFTVDSEVQQVWYNGESLLQRAVGDLTDFTTIKQVSFAPVAGAKLAIQGYNARDSDAPSCTSGGLILSCSSDTPSSPWQHVKSDLVHVQGYGSATLAGGPPEAWFSPDFTADAFNMLCPSTANLHADVANTAAETVWAGHRYGFFLVTDQVAAHEVTCRFTMDHAVTGVWYGGVSLLEQLAGVLDDWKSVKQVSFNAMPGLKLAIQGEADPTGAGSCREAGLLLACQSEVDPSSAWNQVKSDLVHVRGYGAEDGRPPSPDWQLPGYEDQLFDMACPSTAPFHRDVGNAAAQKVWARRPHAFFLISEQVALDSVSCRFSLSGNVTGVWYDGRDLFGDVLGRTDVPREVKEVGFTARPGAALAIRGSGALQTTQNSGAARCGHAALLLHCHSSDHNSPWNHVRSHPLFVRAWGSPNESVVPHKDWVMGGYDASEFNMLCPSTADFLVDVGDYDAEKVWSSDSWGYFLISDQVAAHQVRCALAVQGVLEGVWYGGHNITAAVRGSLWDAAEVKTFSFNALPGAKLALQARATAEAATSPCAAAGLILSCDSQTTETEAGANSSPWHNLQSDMNHVLGYGATADETGPPAEWLLPGFDGASSFHTLCASSTTFPTEVVGELAGQAVWANGQRAWFLVGPADGCNVSDPNACSGHGSCTGQAVCACSAGFYGAFCDKDCPRGPDGSGQVCNGHARDQVDGQSTCDANTGLCDCQNGWLGPACELACPGVVSTGQACNGMGRCFLSPNTGAVECDCNEGRFGADCSGECPRGGPAGQICAGKGACDPLDGTCACHHGYWGASCLSVCPGGATSPCSLQGECEATTGTCRCFQGWGGPECSERSQVNRSALLAVLVTLLAMAGLLSVACYYKRRRVADWLLWKLSATRFSRFTDAATAHQDSDLSATELAASPPTGRALQHSQPKKTRPRTASALAAAAKSASPAGVVKRKLRKKPLAGQLLADQYGPTSEEGENGPDGLSSPDTSLSDDVDAVGGTRMYQPPPQLESASVHMGGGEDMGLVDALPFTEPDEEQEAEQETDYYTDQRQPQAEDTVMGLVILD